MVITVNRFGGGWVGPTPDGWVVPVSPAVRCRMDGIGGHIYGLVCGFTSLKSVNPLASSSLPIMLFNSVPAAATTTATPTATTSVLMGPWKCSRIVLCV